MATPTVRPARPDDAEALARLHVRTWQAAYAGAIPAGYLASLDGDLDQRVARWRRIIETAVAPTRTYVAEVDAVVAGFASVGPLRVSGGGAPEPGVGEVYSIYADPGRWSTGVGLALMSTAEAHLREAGFTEVRLWVLAENDRARRFYERYGFVVDGAETTQTLGAGTPYAVDITEVRYALRLPAPP